MSQPASGPWVMLVRTPWVILVRSDNATQGNHRHHAVDKITATEPHLDDTIVRL